MFIIHSVLKQAKKYFIIFISTSEVELKEGLLCKGTKLQEDSGICVFFN